MMNRVLYTLILLFFIELGWKVCTMGFDPLKQQLYILFKKSTDPFVYA